MQPAFGEACVLVFGIVRGLLPVDEFFHALAVVTQAKATPAVIGPGKCQFS